MRLIYVCCALLMVSIRTGYAGGLYEEWEQQRRERIRQDPAVVRHYTFENVEDAETVVDNLAGEAGELTFIPAGTEEAKDGFQVVEGRRPGNRAVRMDAGGYRGDLVAIEDNRFTAEIWFRINGPGSITTRSGQQTGTIIGNSLGWGQGWRITSTFSLVNAIFQIGIEGGAVSTVMRAELINDGQWHHLAGTWSGSRLSLYLDGELVRQTEKTAVHKPADRGFFYIGYGGISGSLNLDVDEVVIYNRVLSAEEIAENAKTAVDVAQDTAISLLRQGSKLAQEGRHDEARRQYEAIAKLDLPYAKPLSLANIADAYRRQGDHASARDAYRGMLEIEGLSSHYRFYALFNIAEAYTEENNHRQAREIYAKILSGENLSQHYRMRALFGTGDAYRAEKNYTQARRVYGLIQAEAEAPPAPHEHYRTKAIDRLALIDELADGQPLPDPRRERVEWIEKPKTAFYISPDGDDSNPGTRGRPFATPERARDAIRELRADKGLPEGGVAVYLRGGRYFRTEPFELTTGDSGTPDSPIVYRAYPGEEVRLIGGVEVTGFAPVTDEKILARLPETSRGRVMQADLKAQGVDDYGTIKIKGWGIYPTAGYWSTGLSKRRDLTPAALELSYNGQVMTLARWPSAGWARIGGVHIPGTDTGIFHGRPVNNDGKFKYSGDRPERWAQEQEIWMKGYWSTTYGLQHIRVNNINVDESIVALEGRRPGFGIAENSPYVAYNLLSEIEIPGEYYVDRETGVLYFYPPASLDGTEEIMASIMEEPLIVMNESSHIVFRDITLEMTRADGIEINDGTGNLIAGCVIRNVGLSGVAVDRGNDNSVVGCDIYETGTYGIVLKGGDRETLTPSGHLVENCRIYRFNRLCGGYRAAVRLDGVGSRVSRNLIYDSPHTAIRVIGNDHVVEYNELFDVVHEARDMGAIYTHDGTLLQRGTIIRHNLFHHITEHSSPHTRMVLQAIMFDSMSLGYTVFGNVFFNCSSGTGGSIRDSRFENNIFYNNFGRSAMYIGPSERYFAPARKERLKGFLEAISYRQPPWSTRYPQLPGIFQEEPPGRNIGQFVERNIFVNPAPLRIARDAGIMENNVWTDNYRIDRDQAPLMQDPRNMNLNLWPGAPAYGESGFLPIPLEEIGLYADVLRASWPVEKNYGRYFKEDRTIHTPEEYTAGYRIHAITVDGQLDPEEWHGLDKDEAMVVERFFTDWTRQHGHLLAEHKSYAWAFHDDEYLYIGVLNTDMPLRDGETGRPLVEVAIEGQEGPFAHWWIPDQATGPIYSFHGHPDGRLVVNRIGDMPEYVAAKLAEKIIYRAHVVDGEKWTAEFRIPFEDIGVNPQEARSLRFNIGVEKRDGWFAWNPTGGRINLLERGGVIRFEK